MCHSFLIVYYWNDTEFLTLPPGVHGCASPCLPVNAGVPLSTAARFSVQANVVFSSPAPSDRDHSRPDGDTLPLLRTQGTDRAPQ